VTSGRTEVDRDQQLAIGCQLENLQDAGAGDLTAQTPMAQKREVTGESWWLPLLGYAH